MPYNEEIYLVFVPASCLRASKTLGIHPLVGAFCYANEEILVLLRWLQDEAGHQKDQHWDWVGSMLSSLVELSFLHWHFKPHLKALRSPAEMKPHQPSWTQSFPIYWPVEHFLLVTHIKIHGIEFSKLPV